jgi:hypothetical protein
MNATAVYAYTLRRPTEGFSDRGLHTIGPKPKPITNSEVPAESHQAGTFMQMVRKITQLSECFRNAKPRNGIVNANRPEC